MNRIFHARVTLGNWAFLFLMTGMTVWCLWEKQAVLGVFLLLLLIVVIDRLIHTTYTVTTDGKLLLYYGRFMRGKEIALKDISKVEGYRGLTAHGVVVYYGNKRFVALQPVKEEEFAELLEKRRV